jgi:hypothetical protein
MNYFDPDKKMTHQTSCVITQESGSPDRYNVVIPVKNGQREVAQLLLREENGQKVFYRQLSAEKRFAGQVLYGKEKVPPHSSVSLTDRGNITALFIQDRLRLSEIESVRVRIPDLEASIMRDSQNIYYQQDPDNVDPYKVNQLLFVKMRDLAGNAMLVYAVDNWMDNGILLESPAPLKEMVEFLSAEAREDEVFLGLIEESKRRLDSNNSLKARHAEMIESIESFEAQIKELQGRLEELQRQVELKNPQ